LSVFIIFILFKIFAPGIPKFHRVSLHYAGVAVFFLLMAFLIRAWRWRVLLRTTGTPVNVGTLFNVIQLSWFVNYLTPARIGDITRIFLLKFFSGSSYSLTFATLLVERLFDLIAILLIVSALSLALSGAVPFQLLQTLLVLMGVILFFIILMQKFEKYLLGLGAVIFRSLFPKRSLKAVAGALGRIISNTPALTLCMMLSISVWILEGATLFFAFKFLNFNINTVPTLLAQLLGLISQIAPTTPGGLGIYEASISLVAPMYGIPQGTAFPAALVDHILRYIFISFFGILALMRLGLRFRYVRANI
jgi:hypothetical protein